MKNPAFLFYVNDFDCGTKFFSDEQVGKYIRLWITQYQHGHLSEQQVMFVIKKWDETLMAKFERDEKGLFYNAELEEILHKRLDYIKSRSENRSRKNKKDMKNISKTYEKHMENEIENEIENKNEIIEGGMGGEISVSLWESVKKNFFNDFRYKEKLCRDKGFPMAEVELRQKEFIDTLELGMDYKDKKELYRHFTNWIIKTKKIKNGTRPTKNPGLYELLDELRSTHQTGTE